jgi:hypothetical protein
MQTKIEEILMIPEDDIYQRIGQELLGLSASPRTREELVEVAKRWLASRREELRRLVCASPKIQSLAKREASEAEVAELAVAVTESIVNLVTGVDMPILVGVLLARHGIRAFCKEVWAE